MPQIPHTTPRPISGEEERLLLEFGHYLRGGRSPSTVAAYQSDIRLFAESALGVDLLRITPAQEDTYLWTLHGGGLKRRTIQRKGTAKVPQKCITDQKTA